MGEADSSISSTPTAAALRKSRAKVKSGCRTCKVRKVKCDEAFPACNRCVSTGRVCDGYGIWGGGGNGYGERYSAATPGESSKSTTVAKKVSVPRRISVRPGFASANERAYYEWFMVRTATKLPGVFGSAFWDTLVLQATSSEPAVLHAVLALSCAHRTQASPEYFNAMPVITAPDEQEQFTLRQYSTAISKLEPHFKSSSKSSMRVALIACVIFTCLEFVRGHYQTGNAHLENGLSLLDNLTRSSKKSDGVSKWGHDDQVVNEWLDEKFARLHLQAVLFGQKYRMPPNLSFFNPQPPPQSFTSTGHARKCLDRLISETHLLTERRNAERLTSDSALPRPSAMAQQARIQTDLAAWLKAYEASRSFIITRSGIIGSMAYQILLSYYAMASIAASTCLRLDGEMAFDSHTEAFRAIIHHSWKLGEIVLSSATQGTAFEHTPGIPPIVADMGWITPLFYTAIKCRVPSVRTEAIRFLSWTECKEGIWDAILASRVARQVMDIEEEGNRGGVLSGALKGIDGMSEEADDSLPRAPDDGVVPPAAARVYDVQVVLPEGADASLGVVCRRQGVEGCETVVRFQHAGSKRWVDCPDFVVGAGMSVKSAAAAVVAGSASGASVHSSASGGSSGASTAGPASGASSVTLADEVAGEGTVIEGSVLREEPEKTSVTTAVWDASTTALA